MHLFLALIGCHPIGTIPDHDDASKADTERIAVTPAEIIFPTVSVNQEISVTRSFSVTNLGATRVTVTGQDEPTGPFRVAATPLLTIDAGETVLVDVEFAPETDGRWESTLVIQPGAETVHLEGEGTAPVAAAEDLNFDPVVLGCTGTTTGTVRNNGREALTFSGAVVGSDEFSVVGFPTSISPDGTDVVELSFTPQGGGPRSTSLVLSTNDPAHPELAVTVDALAYEGERVNESFYYAPSNPTDILFVVDTGESMAKRLGAAGTAIKGFVDAIRTTNVDYHVASLGSASSCPEAIPGFTTRSDTSLETEAGLEQGFAEAPGSWEDDLLDLAAAALDQAIVDGCLAGYRREEADLHVIAITDGPAATSLDDAVDTLRRRVTGEASFRLSALVALGSCGVDGDIWEDAVASTGGVADDLCESDWGPAFLDFSELPPGADPVTYPLAEVPVPSTVSVTVEGTDFDLWSYDAQANAVVFDGTAVPALGAQVEIQYVLAVACG